MPTTYFHREWATRWKNFSKKLAAVNSPSVCQEDEEQHFRHCERWIHGAWKVTLLHSTGPTSRERWWLQISHGTDCLGYYCADPRRQSRDNPWNISLSRDVQEGDHYLADLGWPRLRYGGSTLRRLGWGEEEEGRHGADDRRGKPKDSLPHRSKCHPPLTGSPLPTYIALLCTSCDASRRVVLFTYPLFEC